MKCLCHHHKKDHPRSEDDDGYWGACTVEGCECPLYVARKDWEASMDKKEAQEYCKVAPNGLHDWDDAVVWDDLSVRTQCIQCGAHAKGVVVPA